MKNDREFQVVEGGEPQVPKAGMKSQAGRQEPGMKWWNGTRQSLRDEVVLLAPGIGGFNSAVNAVRSH